MTGCMAAAPTAGLTGAFTGACGVKGAFTGTVSFVARPRMRVLMSVYVHECRERAGLYRLQRHLHKDATVEQITNSLRPGVFPFRIHTNP